ncbi:MAG: YfhO family protein [Patescibacteria group bacterium]
MKKLNFLPLVLFFFIVFIFFRHLFLQGKLPIPSDTIVGLYHPFRDLYSKEYPNGIPFKNFLITDPVRQQFPWRELAVEVEKRFELPLWNPYGFSGTPLVANYQTAAFYPLNFLFFLFPFSISWSILIVFESLMAGVFLYFYLNSLRLNKWASLVGAISFSFSGFFIAWMEWGTIIHTAIWLPLILLSIDKIFVCSKNDNSKFKIQNYVVWAIILVFSLTSSFFAGHLQTFFYLYTLSVIYCFAKWIQFGRKKRMLFLFIILNSLFIILTSVQWITTLQFILLSARDIDQVSFNNPGWFIPWQNLIQFVAPDFFGNPSTLNYWGIWNYGEFIGYVGILPLIMAVFVLFFRRDKKTLFYGVIFFISLIFSFPTIFAKIPYILQIPFLSTIQPTRLLFIIDFSLAVLAAFGFDYFLRHKKAIVYPLIFMILIFVGLWFFVLFGNQITKITLAENIIVAKRNLVFPTLLLAISGILLFILMRFPKAERRFAIMIYIIIVGVTIFDLLRFGFKFTPFTNKEYLFPNTKIISFLQKKPGQFRIMTTDSRIFPPNFSTIYKIQSVDGYDPLYLRRYGEFIAASERKSPSIDPPFGFNRIITPHNYDSKIIDLLGVKYILSLSDIESPKLKKVFQEGQTRVYENKNYAPRVFFVGEMKVVNNKNEAIQAMFDKDFDFRKIAVVEDYRGVNRNTHPMCDRCEAEILLYSENKIVINTNIDNDGFLVLTDSFYPTWHATIDGKQTRIFRTDYNFRGVLVPKGEHTVIFYNTLLGFMHHVSS